MKCTQKLSAVNSNLFKLHIHSIWKFIRVLQFLKWFSMKHSSINDLLSKQELSSKDFEKLHNGSGIKTKYLSQLTLGVLMISFSTSSKYLQYFDLVTTRETCQLLILIAWLELSIGSIQHAYNIYLQKEVYKFWNEFSIIYQKNNDYDFQRKIAVEN